MVAILSDGTKKNGEKNAKRQFRERESLQLRQQRQDAETEGINNMPANISEL